MTHAGHLVRRFIGSLRPGGPPPADEAWARDALLAGERALSQLEAGTYGKCEVCGEQIAEARLEAMPATRWCIEHASA